MPSRNSDLFCCPICRTLVFGPEYSCPKHGTFPKVGNILKFLGDEDQTFDTHWISVKHEDLPREKIGVAEEFINSSPYPLSGRILDAGCGNGVHLKVLSNQNSNLSLYGIDISSESLRQAARNLSPKISLAQADLAHLPFVDGSFDHIISFGVIAYMPNPSQGFSEILRVCRRGGTVGVWFYPKPTGVLSALLHAIRFLTGIMPVFFKNRLADLIVPFLAFLPTKSKVHLGNSNWRQCREVVLVNIAPQNLKYYHSKELEQLIISAGGRILRIVEEQPNTIWFTKNDEKP